MWGRRIDHQLVVDIESQGVVADGAQGVRTRRQAHRAGRLQRPVAGPVAKDINPWHCLGLDDPIDRRLETSVRERLPLIVERDFPITAGIGSRRDGQRISHTARCLRKGGNHASRQDAPGAWLAQHRKPQRHGAGRVDGPELGRLPIVRPPLVDNDRGAVAPGEVRCGHGEMVRGRRVGLGRVDRAQTSGVTGVQYDAIAGEDIVADAIIAAARVVVFRIAPIGGLDRVRP